jgi:uncharacterized protein YfaP (DUF2135 family)
MVDRNERRRERRWPIPYLDLTNTLFFFFVAMFALALMAISDADEKKKVDTTSKLLVTLTWRDGSANDVDLSMKIPNDEVIWFRKRQAGFASLDHDNLGLGNTTVLDADGNPVVSPGRDEVIYIRQTMPGTYVVNVNLYGQYRDEAEPVNVTLASVDPTYHQLITRQLTLTDKHEEHTAFRFTVDARGNVTSTDLVEELFINEILGSTT